MNPYWHHGAEFSPAQHTASTIPTQTVPAGMNNLTPQSHQNHDSHNRHQQSSFAKPSKSTQPEQKTAAKGNLCTTLPCSIMNRLIWLLPTWLRLRPRPVRFLKNTLQRHGILIDILPWEIASQANFCTTVPNRSWRDSIKKQLLHASSMLKLEK